MVHRSLVSDELLFRRLLPTLRRPYRTITCADVSSYRLSRKPRSLSQLTNLVTTIIVMQITIIKCCDTGLLHDMGNPQSLIRFCESCIYGWIVIMINQVCLHQNKKCENHDTPTTSGPIRAGEKPYAKPYRLLLRMARSNGLRSRLPGGTI